MNAEPLSEAKRQLFTSIVAGVQAQWMRDTAPAPSDEAAREEIEDHFDRIAINLDEEDTDEALLENLANTVAATLRMAERVMQRMTEEQLAAVMKEVG